MSDPADCTLATCDLATYGNISYLPNLAGNVAYLSIFGVLFFVHLGLGYRYKTGGFTVPMLVGLTAEVVGYIGRLLIRQKPFLLDPFLVYLIPLTLGPACMTAGIYLTLGHIIEVYGISNSRIAPKTYMILFMSCDMISLVLQAAGGSLAVDAGTRDEGVDIMMAGLSFQVASLALYLVLWADFIRSVRKNASTNDLHFAALRGS
ncbi:hypothetical protein HKX48_001043, partial [Thoreauomyces humboldtii]